MSQTLYLIFTDQGYREAKKTIFEDKALLWINPDILDETQITELSAANITFNMLDIWVKPGDEKATLNVIKSIEQNMKKVKILVEYL